MCYVLCCGVGFIQPNFGASLHILKVEIGGDGQTTGNPSVYLLSVCLVRII